MSAWSDSGSRAGETTDLDAEAVGSVYGWGAIRFLTAIYRRLSGGRRLDLPCVPSGRHLVLGGAGL